MKSMLSRENALMLMSRKMWMDRGVAVDSDVMEP